MSLEFFPMLRDVRKLTAKIPAELLPEGFSGGESGQISYLGVEYACGVSSDGILCAYPLDAGRLSRPRIIIVPLTDGRRDFHFANTVSEDFLFRLYARKPDPTLDPRNFARFWPNAPERFRPCQR